MNLTELWYDLWGQINLISEHFKLRILFWEQNIEWLQYKDKKLEKILSLTIIKLIIMKDFIGSTIKL